MVLPVVTCGMMGPPAMRRLSVPWTLRSPTGLGGAAATSVSCTLPTRHAGLLQPIRRTLLREVTPARPSHRDEL
jgi:hypothetical protein